ncbi:MAG: hypothetical protein ACJ8M1_15610 [Chthoniobacterales bacterium]
MLGQNRDAPTDPKSGLTDRDLEHFAPLFLSESDLPNQMKCIQRLQPGGPDEGIRRSWRSVRGDVSLDDGKQVGRDLAPNRYSLGPAG